MPRTIAAAGAAKHPGARVKRRRGGRDGRQREREGEQVPSVNPVGRRERQHDPITPRGEPDDRARDREEEQDADGNAQPTQMWPPNGNEPPAGGRRLVRRGSVYEATRVVAPPRL
jgi:hypothetical protein